MRVLPGRPSSSWTAAIASLALVTVCAAYADLDTALVGTWEYRQAAGDGFDAEGERLEVARVDGRLQAVYFGLEREGEHGLFYSAVPVRCVSSRPSCPDRVMVFQKGAWMRGR